MHLRHSLLRQANSMFGLPWPLNGHNRLDRGVSELDGLGL
jgi:hypothetical protein